MLDLDLVVPKELAPETIWRLSREDYQRMVAMGIFGDARIELLYGVLVCMSPQSAPHAEIVDRLAEWLLPALRGRARVRIQGPFAASRDSQPEPDVAVYPQNSYADGHPAKPLLLIEVADTSLNKDRYIKAPLYAVCGCPEYWIVNLRDRVVEVHTEPRSDGSYASLRHIQPSGSVAPIGFPDAAIEVGKLFHP